MKLGSDGNGEAMTDGRAHRTKSRSAPRWPRAAAVALTSFFALLSHPASADNRDVPLLPLDWVAKEERSHPLAGRIWSAAAGDFVTAQQYGTHLAKTRFVLLGEVHDNPDHHRLQAWAIATISKLRGARLVEGAPQMDVVAMEMLTPAELPALDRFYGRNARVPRVRSAEDFGRMLKWDKLGWPDYATYQPIVEEALKSHLTLTPASPARDENRRVSKEGLSALEARERMRLALDQPLAPTDAAALADEIRDSHCGMLPAAALPNMSEVQRLRDARMADAMLVSEWKGAILIAGNGHVRKDRGAPLYLARRGIGASDMVVVKHVEVEAGKEQAADYELTPENAHADYVIFTPRQPRPEPCEEMRRQMEAIKARAAGSKEPAPAAAKPGGSP